MRRLITFVTCLALFSAGYSSAATNRLSSDSGSAALKRDTFMKVAITNPAVFYTGYQLTYKRRLDSIKKEVPLPYNEFVQTYIDNYSARKNDMGHVLGLAKYYFPIYEKAFHDAGIPDEIKFLSIVESELNPNAVSRTGAAGPWQFMYATGKSYGLNVNDYVDERRDPIQASYAAAAYLKDAYQEFGDWLLAIASYNCGKSTVERAIDQAGVLDFWAIRQYLPAETRGYVPAYIAVSYIMNYYDKHGIAPQNCSLALNTDTVLVNKVVSLNNVAALLNTDAHELAILNPAYKRGLVNGTATAPRRLVLPKLTIERFSSVYNALNADGNLPQVVPAPAPAYTTANVSDHRPVQKPLYHLVKRGETLEGIADRYGVEVQDLKAWNNLHSSKPVAGTKLKLAENLSANVGGKTVKGI